MRLRFSNECGFTCFRAALLAIECDDCLAGCDHPGFFALLMLLIAESVPRMHVNPFQFVIRSFFEHLPEAPWCDRALANFADIAALQKIPCDVGSAMNSRVIFFCGARNVHSRSRR